MKKFTNYLYHKMFSKILIVVILNWLKLSPRAFEKVFFFVSIFALKKETWAPKMTCHDWKKIYKYIYIYCCEIEYDSERWKKKEQILFWIYVAKESRNLFPFFAPANHEERRT